MRLAAVDGDWPVVGSAVRNPEAGQVEEGAIRVAERFVEDHAELLGDRDVETVGDGVEAISDDHRDAGKAGSGRVEVAADGPCVAPSIDEDGPDHSEVGTGDGHLKGVVLGVGE